MKVSKRAVLSSALAAATLTIFGFAVQAASFAEVTLSGEKDGEAMMVFDAATKRIHLTAGLKDVRPGTRVKGEWVAVKVDGTAPEFRIQTAELEVDAGMRAVSFSLGKPNTGWSAGNYRVDLYIDGRPAQKVKFKVRG